MEGTRSRWYKKVLTKSSLGFVTKMHLWYLKTIKCKYSSKELSILSHDGKDSLPRPITWEVRELSAPGATRFSVPGATSSASASPSTPKRKRKKSLHHGYLTITLFLWCTQCMKAIMLIVCIQLQPGYHRSWPKTDRKGEPLLLPSCQQVFKILLIFVGFFESLLCTD